MTTKPTPQKGDIFVWRPSAFSTKAIMVEVMRVARDGSWLDIRAYAPSGEWTKRQPLPLPDTFVHVGVVVKGTSA